MLQWRYIEVDTDDLPWPASQFRRNSRVPKLLPHLFFPPSVKTTVYIDAENSIEVDHPTLAPTRTPTG